MGRSAEYYDKKGKIEKTYEVFKLERIDGIWSVLEFSIENPKTGHQTKVTVNQVQYNRGIPGECFGRRELER